MTIIFIRTVIIFASIIFLLRLLGKRQLRELELSELVVSVMLADLAATPLQDIGIPLLNGLIPIVTLFACELAISGGILSSVRFRGIMCGKPEFLIIDGQILEKEMRKARFSVDELFEELRNKDILDIKKVKYAVLETDGSLSVFLFPEYQPVTPRDMKIEPMQRVLNFSVLYLTAPTMPRIKPIIGIKNEKAKAEAARVPVSAVVTLGAV